ncbi:hypothetical protein [Corynebacterium nuruki]|uniref:hypothetical protein n=1 Tax=Corynebacterium nuruki TaxID=1032851 RepID=UPI0039BFA79D
MNEPDDLPPVPRNLNIPPVIVPRDQAQTVCDRLAAADDLATEAQRITTSYHNQEN